MEHSIDEIFLIKEIENIEKNLDLEKEKQDNYKIHFPYDWIIEMVLKKVTNISSYT